MDMRALGTRGLLQRGPHSRQKTLQFGRDGPQRIKVAKLLQAYAGLHITECDGMTEHPACSAIGTHHNGNKPLCSEMRLRPAWWPWLLHGKRNQRTAVVGARQEHHCSLTTGLY